MFTEFDIPEFVGLLTTYNTDLNCDLKDLNRISKQLELKITNMSAKQLHNLPQLQQKLTDQIV